MATTFTQPDLPIIRNYYMYHGGDWTAIDLLWEDANGDPVDLTSGTATFKMAKENPATYRSAYSQDAAVVSLTESTGISLGGTAGTISVSIDKATVDAISAPETYLYTLTVTLSSDDYVILSGYVRVNPKAGES